MKSWFCCHQRTGTFAVICVVLGLAALSGCGSDLPPLGEVEGTVTLDGQPLPDAMVFFTPEGGGRSSTGFTDASGRYTLSFTGNEPGAVVGNHKVRITTGTPPELDDSGKEIAGKPERVPEQYSEGIAQEVKAGKQTIDFALTTSR